MEPGTTEKTKPESERMLIQTSYETSTSSDDSRSPSSSTKKTLLLHGDGQPLLPHENEEPAVGRNEHEASSLGIIPSEEDEDEQLESLVDSDEEEEDDDPTTTTTTTTTHGCWLGNEDQMADLVLILRWAHAYRVSIEGAGRMLKMQPEIVNRAAEVHAQQSTSSGCDRDAREAGVAPSTRPVIKHWVRLGPL